MQIGPTHGAIEMVRVEPPERGEECDRLADAVADRARLRELHEIGPEADTDLEDALAGVLLEAEAPALPACCS